MDLRGLRFVAISALGMGMLFSIGVLIFFREPGMGTTVTGVALALGWAGLVGSMAAGAMGEQRARLQELERRVQELERRLSPAAEAHAAGAADLGR
jgi:hypothetical protein